VHHLELLIAKMQADQVGDVLVVLDHEDAFGLFHPGQSFGAMSACHSAYVQKNCGSGLARESVRSASITID
jgi:hypothetical protein